MTRIKSRPAALLVLSMLAATCFLVSAGGPAAAQTCGPGQVPNPNDPYGCIATTTTTAFPPSPLLPNCIVSNPNPVVGSTVEVIITNVPVGITVSLMIGSLEVDRKVAGDGTLSAAALPKSARSTAAAKAAAQTGYADVTFRFVVPQLAAGTYTISAVGPNFRCDCNPIGVQRDIAGSNVDRPGGGGGLARTGFTVLGLLVIAAALIVVGRTMVESSRRRRPAS